MDSPRASVRTMALILDLRDAIREFVHDGDTVAMEGFTHLIPSAAGHEIIRQQRRDLTLVRMTPDLIYDQMIGMGCARKLVFSWGGNPGVGSLHRLRDAVEHGWPSRLEIEEHTHAGMAAAYAAGASNLPFGVLRGYLGIVHAQQADREGNVLLWGIVGIQKEAVMAARRSIVTVEELVDRLEPRANSVVLPGWIIGAVSQVAGGAFPSYAMGYYPRDNAFYRQWDEISRERDGFTQWIERHVLATEDFAEFRRSIAPPGGARSSRETDG